MSPNRAARRSKGKRAWRREAQRAADRAADLSRRGYSVETSASAVHLSPALVGALLEDRKGPNVEHE